MRLPEKIAALRKAKRLSQQALGFALRVRAATISRWEAGEDHPGGENLRKLADFFEIQLSALVDDTISLVEAAAATATPSTLRAMIPVFGYGSAGEGLQMNDQHYPMGPADFEIARSISNPDPHAYATRVKGNSMYPRLWDGDVVELRTDVEVTNGDMALVIHDDGTKWIKKVTLLPRRKVIRCEPLNPAEQPFEVSAELVKLHKIVSIRGPGML